MLYVYIKLFLYKKFQHKGRFIDCNQRSFVKSRMVSLLLRKKVKPAPSLPTPIDNLDSESMVKGKNFFSATMSRLNLPLPQAASASAMPEGISDPEYKPAEGHLGNLTVQQQHILQKFRKQLEEEGLYVPERHDDTNLLRYDPSMARWVLLADFGAVTGSSGHGRSLHESSICPRLIRCSWNMKNGEKNSAWTISSGKIWFIIDPSFHRGSLATSVENSNSLNLRKSTNTILNTTIRPILYVSVSLAGWF